MKFIAHVLHDKCLSAADSSHSASSVKNKVSNVCS